jgi:hypothetical protein
MKKPETVQAPDMIRAPAKFSICTTPEAMLIIDPKKPQLAPPFVCIPFIYVI